MEGGKRGEGGGGLGGGRRACWRSGARPSSRRRCRATRRSASSPAAYRRSRGDRRGRAARRRTGEKTWVEEAPGPSRARLVRRRGVGAVVHLDELEPGRVLDLSRQGAVYLRTQSLTPVHAGIALRSGAVQLPQTKANTHVLEHVEADDAGLLDAVAGVLDGGLLEILLLRKEGEICAPVSHAVSRLFPGCWAGGIGPSPCPA